MKDFIIAVAIFALILLLTPLLMAGTGESVNKSSSTYAISQKTVNTNLATASKDIIFKISDGQTGAQSTVEGFDFICGVVAGEMPSEYDEQALKAQAVAAFSYCCHIQEHAVGGADIRTGVDVAYLPYDNAKKLWGADFEKQWSKIENAVREVYGKAMFYDGDVIEANYCDMSSGETEDNKDVFGNNVPYLVEVSSPGDKLEKTFETRVTLTLKQFKAKVESFYSGVRFDGDPEKFITDVKRSGAGGVLTATLCGKNVSGRQIRSLFDLRSTNFTFVYADGKFTFDVKGYGHGVGMSQCGAQYMARQGKTWQEILEWYFKGAVVGDYFAPDSPVLAEIRAN